jgi:hypothetical protein
MTDKEWNAKKEAGQRGDRLAYWQYLAACMQQGPDEMRLEIGRMSFEAEQRKENSSFLHQSHLYHVANTPNYTGSCLCSRCSPGAARGLFGGVMMMA